MVLCYSYTKRKQFKWILKLQYNYIHERKCPKGLNDIFKYQNVRMYRE